MPMTEPRVLRACEATTFDVGMNPVPCGEPGQWREMPNGRAYVVCQHHFEVFTRAVGA